jgi:hypothetical protein
MYKILQVYVIPIYAESMSPYKYSFSPSIVPGTLKAHYLAKLGRRRGNVGKHTSQKTPDDCRISASANFPAVHSGDFIPWGKRSA